MTSKQHICGLYFTRPEPNRARRTQRHYLPQVRLDSNTTITSVCYTTNLKQTFRNPNSETISQARYTFPLYDGVAVSSYTITYGDKALKGIVQQKDVAKERYEAAIDRGETAGLLEALPAGTFGVTLGNLPTKTDVHVDIVYCGELRHDAAIDGLRYMLPTSIAPRYGEYPGELLEATATTDGGISITVDIDMDENAIRKVQSPSHPIAVSMGGTSTEAAQSTFNASKASTTLTLGTAELAGDLVLQLLIDDISKPQAIIEHHPDIPSRAVMATFVPKFNLDTAHPEIVFIADQSGSMQGSKNKALVSALKVFIKSLPTGVRFNICAFGSRYEFLRPKSQAYNEENMEAAIKFVDTFQAQYGGTQLLEPVKAVFEQKLGDMPLEVMLLTDGEIWGEQALFEYIDSQVAGDCVDARLFGLGIGSDVSHTLVEGVARVGKGFAQFVTQDEETDKKVIRMLKGALYPHLTERTMEVRFDKDAASDDASDEEFELVEKVDYCLDIEDSWPVRTAEGDSDVVQKEPAQGAISLFDSSNDPDKPIQANDTDRFAHLPAVETPKILQAPSTMPSLFPFNRTTVYLILGSDTPQKPVSSITLRANSPQGPLQLTMDVNKSVEGKTVHQLAARRSIQELETGHGWLNTAKTTDGALVKEKHQSRFDELIEREAVRLGERFQVASKWTSFVAIEDSPTGTLHSSGPAEPEVREMPSRSYTRGSRPEFQACMMDSPPGAAPKKKGFACKSAAPRRAAHALAPVSATADQDLFSRHFQNIVNERPTANWNQVAQQTSGNAWLTSAVPPPPPMASASNSLNACGAWPASPSGATSNRFLMSASYAPAPRSNRMGAPRFGAAPAAQAEEAEERDDDDDDNMGFGLFDDDIKVDCLAVPASSQRTATRTEAAALPSSDLSSKAGAKATVHNLIGLQKFGGSWEWSDELFAALQMKDRVPEFDDAFGSKAMMATALAVAFLESRLAESRDVWEMVVEKARTWMSGQVAPDAVHGLLEKAKVLL